MTAPDGPPPTPAQQAAATERFAHRLRRNRRKDLTMTVDWQTRDAELEETRKEERAADAARADRQLDLMERDVVLREKMLGEGVIHHAVEDDDATARLSAFFRLPLHEREFRLREESVDLAVKLGGPFREVLENAQAIADYIRG